MSSERWNTLVLTGANGVAAALALVFLAVAGRLLRPDAYSDFAAALSIVHLGTFAIINPLNQTIAHHVARLRAMRIDAEVEAARLHYLNAVWRWGLPLLPVAAALAFPVARWLRIPSPLVPFLGFAILFALVHLNVERAVIQGEQRVAPYAVNFVSESALRLLFGAALVLRLGTPSAGLTGYFLSIVVAAAPLTLARGVPAGRPGLTTGGYSFTTVFSPLLIVSIASAAFQNSDVLFVKAFFTGSEAGRYAAVAFLAKALQVLVLPFSVMLTPSLELAKDARGARRTLTRLCLHYAASAAAATVVLAVVGETFITLLYGAAYAPAAHLIVPLAIATCLSALSYLIGHALALKGRLRFALLYLALAGVQWLAFSVQHRSLDAIPQVMIAVQAAAVALLALAFAASQRR
ncbi:MAG TPA: hypothetical protein VNL91_07260 [Thermoanaerobaculia bacterium]|nr:hypothetical protein [Thermoanaerobaculia bacterium]